VLKTSEIFRVFSISCFRHFWKYRPSSPLSFPFLVRVEVVHVLDDQVAHVPVIFELLRDKVDEELPRHFLRAVLSKQATEILDEEIVSQLLACLVEVSKDLSKEIFAQRLWASTSSLDRRSSPFASAYWKIMAISAKSLGFISLP